MKLPAFGRRERDLTAAGIDAERGLVDAMARLGAEGPDRPGLGRARLLSQVAAARIQREEERPAIMLNLFKNRLVAILGAVLIFGGAATVAGASGGGVGDNVSDVLATLRITDHGDDADDVSDDADDVDDDADDADDNEDAQGDEDDQDDRDGPGEQANDNASEGSDNSDDGINNSNASDNGLEHANDNAFEGSGNADDGAENGNGAEHADDHSSLDDAEGDDGAGDDADDDDADDDDEDEHDDASEEVDDD